MLKNILWTFVIVGVIASFFFDELDQDSFSGISTALGNNQEKVTVSTTNDSDYILPNKLLAIAVSSTADDIVNVGDTAVIPEWTWITVQNLDEIKSGNGGFFFGEKCGIKENQTISVVAIDGDDVLVRYNLPYPAYGSPCPDGTLFFVSKTLFLGLTDQYLSVKENQSEEKSRIKRLLSNN